MTSHPTATVRTVAADLVQARDAQITRVVAMVDGMPDRGAADALIAPLRGRLAQLRPARAFGFTRLLFSPLDPVIVPGARWRRGEVGVPRKALALLGAAVQAALPALSQALEPSACRLVPNDRPAIAALGAGLWPAAAEVLERMRAPDDWSDVTDLFLADFAEITGVMAAVLRQADAIETLAAVRDLPTDSAIRAVLNQTEKHGTLAVATVLSILLARLPVPDRVVLVAADLGPAYRHLAAEQAMDHTLASLQAAMKGGAADSGDIGEAAAEAARVATLLSGLEKGPPPSPDRRRKLEQIRKEADSLCRGRFDRAIADTLTQAGAFATGPLDDTASIGFENAARDLRRLESAGRRLGSSEHYDALVKTVSTQMHEPRGGLPLIDRVRMVEILSGPDEALALLFEQG